MATSIVYPVAWFFERQRKEQEEKLALERLKLTNLLARLNSLQQQMNPDFLFGGLQALRTDSNDEWTRDYAAELAGIYRYLLSLNHESHLVKLDDELRFTQAYIHILRQRFEDSIDLSLRIGAGARDRYIPPLALQTVVENAIKHNALSPSSPLHICIYDEGDLLVVENDLLRPALVLSSGSPGIGLRNLEERYRLIGGVSPLIIRQEAVFIVKLPLLHDLPAAAGR
jgi:LytS/YehU family sensor histidine kinase